MAYRRSNVISVRFKELATMRDQKGYLVYQKRQRNCARAGRPNGNGGNGTTKLAIRTIDEDRSIRDWLAMKRLVTPRRSSARAMTRSTRPLPRTPNMPKTVYMIIVDSWFCPSENIFSVLLYMIINTNENSQQKRASAGFEMNALVRMFFLFPLPTG